MVRNFDHMTVAVTDVDHAVGFFGLLGFDEVKRVVISGSAMEAYLGVPGVVADHVTMVLAGSEPRQEVQVLHYRHPEVRVDTDSGDLLRAGFNHICFRVDDLDAEVERLTSAGVTLKNEPMQFHDRRLVFLAGPEGVTVELAEWL
jgi:catechol 2,3-dioxygenase-like lactoylglutathione lyase family enzyme